MFMNAARKYRAKKGPRSAKPNGKKDTVMFMPGQTRQSVEAIYGTMAAACNDAEQYMIAPPGSNPPTTLFN